MGAKKLRKMIGLMGQLTLEDLEMEVEEIEAKVTELMETEEESRESRDEDIFRDRLLQP